MYVLGLMSGTSMDGLDCCLCDIYINDQSKKLKFDIIKSKSYDFDSKTRLIIYDYIFNKKYSYKYVDNYLGDVFLYKIIDFLKNDNIELISMHGQTVSHKDQEYSIQLGNPKLIFDKLKIPIAYNFRDKDILNKGNGAPLTPYLDWLLYKNLNYNTISINIGGISNISLINSKANKK